MVFVTFATSIGAVFKIMDAIARGVPWAPVVRYFLYSMPTSIVMAIPLGCLVSCLLVYGRLSDDGEVMAMQTLGLGLGTVIRSTVLVVCGLVALSLYINHEVEPRAHLGRRTEQARLKSVSPLDIIDEGRFFWDIPNIGMYVGHRKDERVRDVRIYDGREPGLVREIHAHHGVIYETGEGKNLKMDLVDVRINPFSKEVQRAVYVDEWSLEIEHLGQQGHYRPDEEDARTRELWATLRDLRSTYAHLNAEDLALQRTFILFEINRRSAMAFSSLALILIGIPLGIRSHRKSTGIGVALSLVIFLAFYMTTLLAQSLVKVPAAQPHLLIWLPVIIFAALGIRLVRRKDSHRMKRENRIGIGVAVALAVLTALRLWVCTRFELIGDEAYYWQWSRHLDWCYYSKGPLVACTIRLGTLIFGNTVLGIRFFSVGIGTATLVLLYWLSSRLFSRRVAIWTLILAACTPLFVIGSLLMTIDPLFIFFWLAAACVFWRAKNTDRIGPWVLTGLLVGLGMLAKYTNVALLPSFALFLGWSKPYRSHLRRPTFWLMCLAALACLVPVLWWNARHNWITFVHLQERGALDQTWRFSFSEWLQYVIGQLGAYYPFFFIGILFSLVYSRIRKNAPVAYAFLASLALPLLAFYSILAVNDAGEANWTAAAVISALPLMAATWCELGKTSLAARIIGWIALPPAIVLATVLLAAPAIRIPGVETLLYRIRGWDDLAQQVEQFNEAEGLSFVIGDHYQTASLLAFYMDGNPRTFIVNRPRIQNQYSFWRTYGGKQLGQDAVYVTRQSLPPADLKEQFSRIDPPQETWSRQDGRRVRKFFLHPCRNYRSDG